MSDRRLRVTGFLACAAAWLLVQSAAAVPVSGIAALVSLLEASNSTAAVDSFGDYLAGLPTREGDQRGYLSTRAPESDLVDTRTIIYEALAASLGRANVSYQSFTVGSYAGVNVIGILPGQGPAPVKVYVLGAHYDSEQNPGADDDASGVAGLLEAARVMGRYRFDGTIVFVAFDQEEERRNGWGIGSQQYASLAKTTRLNLQAMVGLDMVGYNHLGRNRASISRCDSAAGSAHAQLSAKMVTAFQDYSGLSVLLFTGENASDPYRFYQAGYPSLLVSEEFDSGAWPVNPYYHRANDFYLGANGQVQQYAGRPYIDVAYAAKILRGVVGWAATEAGYIGTVGPPQISERSR